MSSSDTASPSVGPCSPMRRVPDKYSSEYSSIEAWPTDSTKRSRLGPGRVLGIEAQQVLPQRVGDRRQRHRRARVARIGLLDRIHGERADRVDSKASRGTILPDGGARRGKDVSHGSSIPSDCVVTTKQTPKGSRSMKNYRGRGLSVLTRSRWASPSAVPR